MGALQETSVAGVSPGILFVRRPRVDEVGGMVLAGQAAPLSYTEVGASVAGAPPGYDFDAESVVVGRGATAWEAAKTAIRRWAPFDLPWISLHRTDAPIAVGQVVAFSSWQLGVWAVNVCRIVEVVDDDDGVVARFGFAYGTLRDHVVRGEERFVVSWDRRTDDVRFEIRKFSSLQHPLVRLLGPLARRVQRRFTVEALGAVARAVRS